MSFADSNFFGTILPSEGSLKKIYFDLKEKAPNCLDTLKISKETSDKGLACIPVRIIFHDAIVIKYHCLAIRARISWPTWH